MTKAPDSQNTDIDVQRTAALDAIFGRHALHFPSPVPFWLGGDATILAYEEYLLNQVVYVTSEMTGGCGTGQKPGQHGEFELVMVLPKGSRLAPTPTANGVVRKGWLGVTLHGFAKYSTQATIAPGDVAGPLPDAFLPHTHLIFIELNIDNPMFAFGGKQYGLMLLMSIHESERRFCEVHGATALTAKLRKAGVFPVTDPTRDSVV